MNSVLVVLFSSVFVTLVTAENPDIIWKIIYPKRASHPSILITAEGPEDQALQDASEDGVQLRMPRNLNAETDNKLEEEDVYWRTWKNKIPSDAIVAGHTQTVYGIVAPVFLAQVYVPIGQVGLQPGNIFLHSKSVKASYGGSIYRSDKQVKVLCAKDQGFVSWIPVNQTANLTAEKDCVIAGYEGNTRTLYFGRAIYDGDLIIGKANIKDKSLHYAYAGSEKFMKQNFEVLCYKEALLKIKQNAEETKEKEEKVIVKTNDEVPTSENISTMHP